MWNYRVMKRKETGIAYYAIHEVYYDGGKITGFTKEPVEAQGNTPKELRADLLHMIEALALPVLDYNKRCKDEDEIV